MCLAIPGKILKIRSVNGLKMADVDFNGLIKSICISWIDNATIGDFILSHCGMGICKIDKIEAEKEIEYIKLLYRENNETHEK